MSEYRFYLYLSYLSLTTISVPILVGLVKRKNFGVHANILLVLMILSLVTEGIVFALHKYHLTNLFVARLYDLVEGLLISFFFIKVLGNSIISVWIKIFVLIYISIAAFDLYMNGFNSLDNISLTTECILLMIYSILAFFHLIQNPVYENILSAPLFWFNTGILLYFSGNLFLFVFSNYIENHFAKASPALWGIHSAFNITFYLLISIGFWRTEAKRI